MQKLVVDLSKPKGQREQYIDLTPEEIEEKEQMAAESEARRLEEEKAAAEKEAQVQSAKDKLAALGLTESEITAVLGN